MDQATATTIIGAAALLLGVVIGRLLEGRSESQRWWRAQRRDAYAQLLVSEQRFHHFISLPESERAPDQDFKRGWLAVQEAAAVVDLVAPDKVTEDAKQFVARSRRYYLALGVLPADPSVLAELNVAQDKDRALDERIRGRRAFVSSARTDLLRRRG